ncbi:MAG: alginate lyase family protein [Bacteroidaceae bacterium]|nr:alginate lyase family protein [Bacteroidaceae bacterium]
MERIKQHVNQKDDPWITSWRELQTSSYGNCTRTANPSTEIGGSDGNRQRADADATTALIEAIEWHVTGQKKFADHAVKLLSAWGNKVETAKAELFQFPSVTMSMAAEMLRSEDGTFYEGWAEADRDNFLAMVRNILYPACKSQAETNPMTSWSAPAMAAVLAAGILLDDEAIYEEGLSYFRTPSIPGSVYNSIAAGGQLKEMGRDNVHAMLTLGAQAQMAQMAWCQGDDLYGEGDNRLLRGFEYWCTYNLGHEDLYYEPVTASDGSSSWYYISTHNNGFRLRPDARCYEKVYHHYKEVKGLDMETLYPSVTAYARLSRPEDGPEFGTLFYTIDAANSPLVSEVPAAAEELTAEGGVGSVWLAWKDTRRDDASGFRVLRSDDGVQFSTIADKSDYLRKSYRDETVEAGHTYYYKVVLYNRAGDAAASDVVGVYVPNTGGLPDGWKTAKIGNGWTIGYYTNSLQNSFVVEGGGNGFRRSDEGHGFVYRTLKGNGSLTVRLVSTEQTYNALGIMLRGSLSSGSPQVGITLGGTGLRYCHAVTRTASGNQTNWKTGCDFTYAPVWMRIEREGRTVRTYQSRDGQTWHLIQEIGVTLPTTAYIGMIVCASETYRATYDHVTFEPATEQAATSTTPIGLTATCVLGATAHLVWTGIYGAEKYLIYRDGQLIGETTTNSYDDSGLSEATYSYTVSAVVASEEGEQSETATVEIVNIEKLTGTVIGTTGSWNNNSATTRTAVFDGNLTTYFDASQSNGAWVGLDLGASNEAMVTEIRFCPRKGYASRMNGGRFQGAATRAFTNAVTLYTITEDPTDATLSSVAIDNPTAFRYLRYIGPDGGNCNVAEVQFFGRKASAVGIHTIETSNLKPETSAVYDLGGRKVNKPTKGLYIKNGKKVVIR